MKSIVVFLLLGLALSKYSEKREQEIVDYVNNLGTTWKAKMYHRDYTPLLGAIPSKEGPKLPRRKFAKKVRDFPEHYDLREQYPNCETLFEIRDQSMCGSCWAFASVETMSDRLCIHSQGRLQTRVSAENLIACCPVCGLGCHGGLIAAAFLYWETDGLPSGGLHGDKNSCQPYFLPECDDHPHQCEDYVDTPECETTCQEGYPIAYEDDKTYAETSYSLLGEEEMMQDIMDNGSIASNYIIYEDFNNYSEGIYQHVTGDFAGMHSVKIIGWGEENGVKYWIIANSWNARWGENGFFRMIRGVNECGIETDVHSVIPKL